MDLPCTGAAPMTGSSTSLCLTGVLNWLILLPSINTPLPPIKEIKEQSLMYGDVEMIGLAEDRPL